MFPFAGKKIRPLSGRTSTASSAPPEIPLPGAMRKALLRKSFLEDEGTFFRLVIETSGQAKFAAAEIPFHAPSQKKRRK